MALATFLSFDGFNAAVAVATVLLGGMSTVLNLALGNALVPNFKTPPFTLAFNLTMLLFLLGSTHFAPFAMPHHAQAETATSLSAEPETLASTVIVDIAWVLRSSLVSVAQVFVCESAISGTLILLGMFVSSRISACAAYIGALGGTLLALALGVDPIQIGHGLWGYNSCLTAIASITFFVPSLLGCGVGAIGVALTVLFEAALRTAFAPLHIPVGTLPFCAASIVLLLTQSSIPGFDVVPLSGVSTAEDHLYSARVEKIVEIVGGGASASEDAASQQNDTLHTSSTSEPPASTLAGAELQEVRVEVMREALVLSNHVSPSISRRPSTSNLRSPNARATPNARTPSTSRSNSVHRGCANLAIGLPHECTGDKASSGILHGGSHHGERYVARQLAAMSNSSGHGRRAVELAMRAADAVGLSPTMLSPPSTVHGADHFSSLLHNEDMAENKEAEAAAAASDAAEAAAHAAAQPPSTSTSVNPSGALHMPSPKVERTRSHTS